MLANTNIKNGMEECIVISAINLTEGGTLTILKRTLAAISQSELPRKYKIVALVHDKNLALYDHIHYIEFPKSKKRWIYRLYYEYYHFRKLSKQLNVFLWLSLHDMTPRVIARHQVVYMHNSSSFYKWRWRDLFQSRNYVLFALFYKYLYRINIRKNDYLIVQQNWLRIAFSKMFAIDKTKVIVFPPHSREEREQISVAHDKFTFFFPSLARPFKNFEIIGEAVKLLNAEGIYDFKVVMTLDGKENSYAAWVYKKYHKYTNIDFVGLLKPEQMLEYYARTDVLIFPSKLETWGLPISEFIPYHKPIIVSDLLYAHETCAGSRLTAFFDPENARELARLMKETILGQYASFTAVQPEVLDAPAVQGYEELFDFLLNCQKE